jgi:hypothetical protein
MRKSIGKVNKTKDIRYYLTIFDEDIFDTTYHYLKGQINQKGSYNIKIDNQLIKIYTPELAYLLTTKEFPALNYENNEKTTINGLDFLKTFVDEFKKGEDFFETEYKLSPNTLYGSNAELYVKNIHQNFFHTIHVGLQEGWQFVKYSYPFLITHQEIKKYGYYSGIVSKVEEQIKKHPQIFEKFDKCEHNQEGNAGKAEIKQFNTLKDLFTVNNYEDYIDALVQCEPQLLKNNEGKYTFVGNLQTQKTCVSYWFKFLKT